MDSQMPASTVRDDEAIVADRAYPHRRDDCDCCREFDADMAADYDGLTGSSLRWCHRCAGQVLAQLVLTGHTVTVHRLDTSPPLERGETSDPGWTVELAEQVLRWALPTGSVFLRALVDEGGTATGVRLRELTGNDKLHHVKLTLTMAVRKVRGQHYTYAGSRHLVRSQRDSSNPRRAAVHSYVLPAELVPIFDTALRQLGR